MPSVDAWLAAGERAFVAERYDTALRCQLEALRIDPECVDALNTAGYIYHYGELLDRAADCYLNALRLAPDNPETLVHLGALRHLQGDYAESAQLADRALAMGADTSDRLRVRVLGSLSWMLRNLGRYEDAERVCRKALHIDPDHLKINYRLALTLVTQGKYIEGWRRHETRIVNGMTQLITSLSGPWRGGELHGETILLHAEQGFGDTFQFCRYVPLVAARGGRVVLAVPRPLRNILMTLEGVSDIRSGGDPLPRYRHHCSLMSLSHVFGTTVETVPPPAKLHGNPARWADFLAGLSGLKVGIVWAGALLGSKAHMLHADAVRSMPLTDMAPLLAVPGCSFVSLQTGPPADQLRGMPWQLQPYNVAPGLANWTDTADLIAGLDLVVSVDTAVLHLAASLGKPTWMLDRVGHCWRWLAGRLDSPWYPSLRIFRQTTAGDWSVPVAAAAAELARLALTAEFPATRFASLSACGAGD